MKIRDGNAVLNGDNTEHVMPSESLDIITDDGRTLFNILLREDGAIRIAAYENCKYLGVVLGTVVHVIPIASNAITVSRPEYKYVSGVTREVRNITT